MTVSEANIKIQYILKDQNVTRRIIQRRCGITNPNDESSRKDVWTVSAALAGLVRDRFVSLNEGYYSANS